MLHQTQKAEVTRYDSATNRWVPLFEGVPAATMAYSADGKSVVFTRYPEHSRWKCLLPACANPVRLIAVSGRVTMPRWSPDGKRVACMMQTAAGKWRAGTVDPDGSGDFVLFPDVNAEADPVWSPSGDRIAFGATPNPDAGAEASIHIFHWPSNRIETLPGSRGLHSPAWSPDGSRMAAIRADTREVTLYDFASRRWSRPLPGIRGGYLNWSASGHRLYFLAGVLNKDQAVMAFDPVSGGVAAVTGFSGLSRPGFTFGDWLGMGPGDTPLALRDLGTEEVLLWGLKRN